MSDTTPPCYSYTRFSHPSQAEGDSLRRQTEAAEEWCQRNGVRLDATTTLRDLGKSAYTGAHRKNPDRHALAAFLKLVEQGKVPRGSYLVVEALDRLTREDIQPALLLVLGLLQAGVRIVQLIPAAQVYTDRSGPHEVMLMVVELMRGHSESKAKSDRVGGAWAKKKAAARASGEVLTRRLPAWVEERDGKLHLRPGPAAALKRIFQLAAAGYGLTAVVKRLVREKVPAFADSGKWARSYVGVILKDRRAVGEFQPRRSDGTPDGEPIPNYYPAAVTEAEWDDARAGAAQRTNRRGRDGEHVNAFAGLLRCARDGGTYFAATRTDGHRPGRRGQTQRVLINTESWVGRAPCSSFPFGVFERAVLGSLREIDPHEILNGDEGPDETQALAGELAAVEAAIAAVAAEMEARGDSRTLFNRLRAKEARQAELQKLLAEARRKAAHPLSESWGEAQSLIEALDNAPDPHDARLRLRSALRRLVDCVYLLVVPRGRDRLCAVQVRFHGASLTSPGCQREYLVWYRPPRSNQHGGVPGWYRVASLRSPFGVLAADSPAGVGLAPFDLSDPAGAYRTEHEVLAVSDADLEPMFAGCERQPLL
jgi:DNA invertase Pin-like site-specific DNA recombinase